jgi:hypothetical protein
MYPYNKMINQENKNDKKEKIEIWRYLWIYIKSYAR